MFLLQRPGIQLPSRELCPNTDVYITPGWGQDDLSLVVRNVKNFGTIAIVGNLVLNEKDVTNASIWQRFSTDPVFRPIWESSRRSFEV